MIARMSFLPARAVIVLACCWIRLSLGQPVVASNTVSQAVQSAVAAAEVVVLPKSVPDPIEPFNRVMWGLNREIMRDVVKPTSKVYRFIVRKPIRIGIANFGRNITYPSRLIS